METLRYAAKQAPGRPRRNWLRLLVPAGLILVAVVLVGLVARMPSTSTTLPSTGVLPVNVTTWLVEARPELADTCKLPGIVEPNAVIRVAAEVAGRIERLGQRTQAREWRGRSIPAGAILDEGEPIGAGEPLMYLNKDLLQARFEQAEAQHDYDRRELERVERLFASGTTSKTERDDARTRFAVSKAQRDEAARELERTTIVAPIGGILNRLPMEVGEYAVPGDQVAEIVDIDSVKIVVNVPERDVRHFGVGDSADIIVQDRDDATLVGRISYISELADAAARTTRLEIMVDNRAHLLRSGQIVSVQLTRQVLTDVVMIPLDSVIPLEHGRVVYVVDDDGRAVRKNVELGFIKGREVQILDGLEVGDRLIVAGHRYVGPGQAVEERAAAVPGESDLRDADEPGQSPDETGETAP